VPRSDIDRIREKIRFRQYDMSAHAMEEMAEDFLTILDVEAAVFSGKVIRVEKDDPRGTKYIIVGTALDRQNPVGVVGRFSSNECYLIITVYEVTEFEG
jgi:4-hydroxy-3-methylbut-2-enyl diphosphate reductase IspH